MLLREPLVLALFTALLGYLFGRSKGLGYLGFILGFLLGPLGWAALLLFPNQRHSTGEGPAPEEHRGSGCPRCGRAVSRKDKACPHCGNVLVPIRYEVKMPGESGAPA